MKDVSYLEQVMVMFGSLELTTWQCCPSITTRILFGLMTSIVRFDSAGKTTERKTLKEHTGVNTNAFTFGSRTGPPAESEYAVEPVCVATIKPSAWQLRMGSLSF